MAKLERAEAYLGVKGGHRGGSGLVGGGPGGLS
jgi:hypothetical protein